MKQYSIIKDKKYISVINTNGKPLFLKPTKLIEDAIRYYDYEIVEVEKYLNKININKYLIKEAKKNKSGNYI